MSFYNPYLSLSYGFGSYYNPYYNSLYYPNYYNPYYGNFYGHTYNPGTITTSRYSGPRRFNLNPYINNNSGSSLSPANTNVSTTTSTAPVRRTSAVGDALRRIVSPNKERNSYVTPRNNNNRTRNYNSGNQDYNQRPERTFNNNTPQVNTAPSVRTPSPSPSSGSSAPIRSFGR